nr:class I SAM-dependent methyltransferase [Kordiimonas marina]
MVFGRLLKEGRIDRSDSLLVVCGGELDYRELKALGFTNVTLSSLDTSFADRVEAPYRWAREDAENLSFDDGEFDVVAVHEGLHHCRSPHRSLLEMYRVARKGIVIMESRDSALIRAGCAIGYVADYELEAVADNGLRYGGVSYSSIPNFVYRWTERDLVKTMNTAHPEWVHDIKYFYNTTLPTGRIKMARNPLKKLLYMVAMPAIYCFLKLFPKQANRFGFWVRKEGLALQPWLKEMDGTIDADPAYFATRFNTKQS